MSAKPRDLLKTRVQRLGEVLSLNALKSGQANSQLVVSGNVLTPSTAPETFDVSAGEVVLAQALVSLAAVEDTAITGADTAAGEFRKVLVERNAAGTVSLKIGTVASTQALAELPLGDTDKISVGYIELPASFVVGTTDLTVGMLKQVAYHA